jgi:hypothetical protein
LKALETAANGTQITSPAFWTASTWQNHQLTSWRKEGDTIYEPSLRQVLMLGAGFTPIEQTIDQDRHYRLIQNNEEHKGKADAVLADFKRLIREDRIEEANAVIDRANRPVEEGGLGMTITREMLRNAARGVQTIQPERDIRLAPRRERGPAAEGAAGTQRFLGGRNDPNNR